VLSASMGYCTTEGARPIGKLFHLFRPKVLYEKSYKYLAPLLLAGSFRIGRTTTCPNCVVLNPTFNPAQLPLGSSRRHFHATVALRFGYAGDT